MGGEAGYGQGYQPLTTLASVDSRDRQLPLVVWFYDGDTETADQQKLERKMFGDDDLAISSKFFRCLKIDVSKIEDAEVRTQYAKRTPTLYVLSPSGETLMKKAGRMTTKTVMSGFSKAFKKIYNLRLRSEVRKLNKFLVKVEKAEDAVSAAGVKVKLLKERLAKRDVARTRKALKAAEETVVKAREAFAKIVEERDQMLVLPLDKPVASSR